MKSIVAVLTRVWVDFLDLIMSKFLLMAVGYGKLLEFPRGKNNPLQSERKAETRMVDTICIPVEDIFLLNDVKGLRKGTTGNGTYRHFYL